MSYWYQKEYRVGELGKALKDVGIILQNDDFGFVDVEQGDGFYLPLLFPRLCSSVQSSEVPTQLTVKPNGFTWKYGFEREETYCACRKTARGWSFEIGGNVSVASDAGWRRLSHDHPLSGIVATGPSRHPNFCRND